MMDGVGHIGWNIIKHVGACAIAIGGINASADERAPCNVDNLGTLTLVAHVLFPATAVPRSFCLIPSVTISVNLVEQREGSRRRDREDSNEMEAIRAPTDTNIRV